MAELTKELANCFPAQGPIWAYMQWAHGLSHAPPVFHLASIIPVMGYELCRRGLTLQEYGPPRAWFAIVAGSGSAKSSAIGWAQDFSTDWYREHFEHEALLPKPWVSLEGSLPGVLQTISTMHDSSTGMTSGIFHHDEFSKVLRAEDVLEPLNRAHDCRDLDRNLRYLQKQVDAGMNVKSTIKKPAFSAIVATTPSAFEYVIRPDTLEGGLFSRFLLVSGILRAGDLMPRPLLDEAGRRWALSMWSNWYGSMEAHRLQGLIRLVQFDPEASAWIDGVLFDSLRSTIAGQDFAGSIATRVCAATHRIAAIYAASRLSVTEEPHSTGNRQILVELDDVIRAANLTRACMDFSVELGGNVRVQRLKLSDQQALVFKTITLTGTNGCGRRAIYEAFHRHLNKGQMDLLMDSLADAGLIVEHLVSSGSQGGRPIRLAFTTEAWAKRALLH